MGQKNKLSIQNTGLLDLSNPMWNDRRLTDFLISNNAVAPDQALTITQSIRKQIAEMKQKTFTIPAFEKFIESRLKKFGVTDAAPIRLNESIFIQPEIQLSDNARRVLERRYLKKDRDGNVTETPEELFRRVARHVARAEKKYGDIAHVGRMEDSFYNIMAALKFLPNSPTLMNAGRQLGQLAACFVLPVEDSMEGIFSSLKNAALIHKSGGGTGFSFSRLRPKKSKVGTTGGIASGPVSFMKIFNIATEQVKQGGTRRGANMAILRIDHPDIEEFIFCKKEDNALNNFNISVGVTNAFMDAVKNRQPYDLIDPRDHKKTGELDASKIYHALVQQAWQNGDPGIIFLDRINQDNPTPDLGEIESTNPCGEQPLLPMEACNLGSVNLAKFVVQKTTGPAVDFEQLKQTVHLAVRFLDDTIDMSLYPLPEIRKMVQGNRKIGLGIMGFADLLCQLNIPYNTDAALETAEKIMGFIQDESHAASYFLAKERGVFENYDQSVFKDKKNCAYRNATTTTIAPTGTLSIIAGASSGIEPLFALSFVRTVMDNDQLLEVNPYFEETARKHGFYSLNLAKKIADRGSIKDFQEIPEAIRNVFVTAHDISPKWHIRMQAAFQKYTDNAVSKTVNLPHDATVSDVLEIYDMAHAMGCKGVTIYRDGSKKNQVLSFSENKEAEDSFMTAVKKRPETLNGFTTKVKTGMGNLYVTVTEYQNRPFEVFATIGKSGRSATAKTEAIGRLVSLAFRSGVRVETVVDQLKGIGGEYPVFQNGGLVLSIPDAISRVLENRYLKNSEGKSRKRTQNSLIRQVCPECSQTISFEEGCMKCHYCGYTKCG
ncbi:MAG: ribonucleoside-diphosphate reductase, adenosylcobalamin-dependent [Desulfobacteraceae bacterium 4572_123]|nr:MAG: ribonucleoside-diphosphate reductase, adenosylcobalamin-dependent [Desulfobacteraceae bacterium 4572_123]